MKSFILCIACALIPILCKAQLRLNDASLRYTYIAIITQTKHPNYGSEQYNISHVALGQSNSSILEAINVACGAYKGEFEGTCRGESDASSLCAYRKDQYLQCISPANSVRCSNGGFSSVMISQYPPGTPPPFTLARTAGAACGKASQQAADKAALTSCESASKKRGVLDKLCLPPPFPDNLSRMQ